MSGNIWLPLNTKLETWKTKSKKYLQPQSKTIESWKLWAEDKRSEKQAQEKTMRMLGILEGKEEINGLLKSFPDRSRMKRKIILHIFRNREANGEINRRQHWNILSLYRSETPLEDTGITSWDNIWEMSIIILNKRGWHEYEGMPSFGKHVVHPPYLKELLGKSWCPRADPVFCQVSCAPVYNAHHVFGPNAQEKKSFVLNF